MNILAIIGTIIAVFALICMGIAVTLIAIGYAEELRLVDRLCEYGAKLARMRKGR